MGNKVSLRRHVKALQAAERRHADAMHAADVRFSDTVRAADQRALQIKEQGEAQALTLARDIQTYKDQQHNGTLELLKEQAATFATKDDLVALTDKIGIRLKPVEDYLAAQAGRTTEVTERGRSSATSRAIVASVVGVLLLLLAVAGFVIAAVKP